MEINKLIEIIKKKIAKEIVFQEINIEDNKLIYLNRLSDLIFVIGRCLNRDAGIEENFWNQS